MKIAVIGAGSMGSLFGGLMAKEAEVVLYNHNQNYVDNVNRDGLIMTQKGTKNVVRCRAAAKPEDIGRADIALIFCKYTATHSAIKDAMVSAIDENTIVLTLQNGIGNVDIIKEFIPEDKIAYGFSTLTSDTVAPGHIEMTTDKAVWTYMYPANGETPPLLQELCDLMNRVGIPTQITEEIDDKIWHKLMVNCSQNTLCALLQLDVGHIMGTKESYEIAKQIVCEVVDVAVARGIKTSRRKGIQHVTNVAKSVPGHMPSMYFDMKRKRKTELGCLNDAVAAEGKRLNIPTPTVELVANMIKAIENNYDNLIQH